MGVDGSLFCKAKNKKTKSIVLWITFPTLLSSNTGHSNGEGQKRWNVKIKVKATFKKSLKL